MGEIHAKIVEDDCRERAGRHNLDCHERTFLEGSGRAAEAREVQTDSGTL